MTKRLYKRILLFTVSGLLLFAGAAYGYVIPTLVGREYLDRFYAALDSLDTSLKHMAESSTLSQFTDPDVSFAERESQTAEAMRRITQTRDALKQFVSKINGLPSLPGQGWYGDYQTAIIKRSQGLRVVVQSNEELDQYGAVLSFLAGYTPLQSKLEDYLAQIATVDDFDTMQGRGPDMAAIAAAIRSDAAKLRNLPVPKEYEQLRTEALATFGQAAAGFDHLAHGLDVAVESEIESADDELDAAELKNKTTDKNLLVSLTDSSTIFDRLVELPEKVDYAER